MDTAGRRDEGMDISEFMRIIVRNRKLFFWIVIVSVIGTVVTSLFMTNIYRAKAIIIPAGVISKDQGAAQFLAVQFGISPPTTPASSEILNLLKSNILRERVIENYKLLPLFFPKGELKDKTELQQVWMGIRYLDDISDVNFIQKDNIIEMTVDFEDPVKATELSNYILTELNEHMSGETKRVSKMNQQYLEAQIGTTADPILKEKLYNLISKEILTQTMAEAKENFSFKVIDPPKVPDRKVRPKRALMAVIALFVSSIFAVIVIFIKEALLQRGVVVSPARLRGLISRKRTRGIK
jgi:uncharacterized protein involved in exopolysaccharide biosynthesis